MKNQLEKIMRLLGCSKEEALQVLESDKKIDKGEKLFELNEDQKQAEKKMRSVGCKTVNPYGKQTTRERPPDLDKRFLMETLELALTNFATNEKIVNPEREMTFKFKGKKYKLILSCPRS